MVEKFKVTPYEAYSLTSILADCRVTQVVDIRKGIHCMVPKKNFAAKT
jgi:acetamidase/formamidase